MDAMLAACAEQLRERHDEIKEVLVALPREALDWSPGDRLVHIVVEPPPSRLSAIHAPDCNSESASHGSRTPTDQPVLACLPSTVSRISLQTVTGSRSEQPRLIPTAVRGL